MVIIALIGIEIWGTVLAQKYLCIHLTRTGWGWLWVWWGRSHQGWVAIASNSLPPLYEVVFYHQELGFLLVREGHQSCVCSMWIVWSDCGSQENKYRALGDRRPALLALYELLLTLGGCTWLGLLALVLRLPQWPFDIFPHVVTSDHKIIFIANA